MRAPCISPHSRLLAGRWLTTLLLAVLFLFFNGRICFAANTYTVVQNTQLQFGTMQIPGGSVTDIISTAGGQSGTGTLLYGTVSAGDYTITCAGACNKTMNLSISATGGCTGMTGLSAWQGNYNNGAITGALPFSGLAGTGGGAVDLKLGATASYDSSVYRGYCSAWFDIIILDSGGSGISAPVMFGLYFDVGLALNKNSDINFGTVSALNASTYRISTAGTVSTVSGTGMPLYGATAAGNIQIVGSPTDGITISVGGYIANNGVTPANAQCSYNGGAAGSCSISGAAPGSGTTLLVGVDVAADGTQAGGTTAAPTFTITVAYQ